MMQKRKAYFENSDQQKIFPHCITAVGKGLRESWGSFNEKRKKCIKMLKQNCPNWQGLAEQNVKLAWHCRKLRLLQENEQDLNTVMELDLQEYSPKEINWLRKIRRTIKKSISKQQNLYHDLWQEMQPKPQKGMF